MVRGAERQTPRPEARPFATSLRQGPKSVANLEGPDQLRPPLLQPSSQARRRWRKAQNNRLPVQQRALTPTPLSRATNASEPSLKQSATEGQRKANCPSRCTPFRHCLQTRPNFRGEKGREANSPSRSAPLCRHLRARPKVGGKRHRVRILPVLFCIVVTLLLHIIINLLLTCG